MIIRASNKSTQKEMKVIVSDDENFKNEATAVGFILGDIYKKLASSEKTLRIDIYKKEPELLNGAEIIILKDIVKHSGDWIKRMKVMMMKNEPYCPMCGIRPDDIALLSSAVKKLLAENNRF